MKQGNIGVIQGAGVLLSMLLGSGVLVIPALAAQQSGSYSLLAWIIMAIAILPIVFTFSALGRRYPNDGGTAHFVKHAFGSNASKSIAWLYVSIAPIGPPVVFITGAAYLCQLFNLPLTSALWLELTMLLVVFLLNLIKIETSVRLQTVLSFVVTFIILVISIIALTKETPQVTETTFSFTALGNSMAIIFWCFVGIEAICHIANDFKNPHKEFPKAVIIGVMFAALIYFLLSIVVLKYQAYGTEQQNLLSVAHVAMQSVGIWGNKIIALVGFIGCFCAVNIYVVSFARMLSSMGQEQAVHPAFAKQNRHGSPVVAVFLIVFSIAVILIFRQRLEISFELLLEYANGVFVLIYFVAACSAVKLLTGWGKILAQFSALFCLFICYFVGWSISYGLLVVLVSWLYYKKAHHSQLQES
ncbi:MAG: L-methionine/branched-chain amino acid transporter [Psychromonas sp.]|nr:L-methionine/branched-chain amino acid transporter [Psychromonas sp.]